jgi:ribosome-binding ATPase YchF (GTP1/OBG family)
LQSIENAIPRLEKEVRGSKEAQPKLDAAKRAQDVLEGGTTLYAKYHDDPDELELLKELQLLTGKPFIYVFNVDDAVLQDKAKQEELAKLVAPAEAIFLNAQFESEVSQLDEADAREMLEMEGISEPGLDKLARVGFDTLGLQTYLTAGEKEVRAWQIKKGDTAPKAAGVIHTDFEKGFIKAEVVSYDDLIAAGSRSAAREQGKLRLEGKDYIMQEGDIVEFRFNN